MKMFGIDVSKWNGKIDWRQVKNHGVEFAIIRTGYSDYYIDPCFEENYAGAKAVGIKVGAYHYSYALDIADAVDEAKFMLSLLRGKQFEFPIAFDIEDTSQLTLPNSLKTDMAIAFLNEIERKGNFAMLYTNSNWIKWHFDMPRLNRFALWRAHYVDHTANNPPRENFNEDIWQYGAMDKIPGVTADVTDVNLCYRDFETEIKAQGLNGFGFPAPAPTPKEDSAEYWKAEHLKVSKQFSVEKAEWNAFCQQNNLTYNFTYKE